MCRLALLLLLVACGDPDGSRICLNPPCLVPGRPTPACEAYVTCFERISPGQSLQSTYGNGGVCWSQGQSTADACTAACSSAISSLRTAFPDAGC
jgi:hypothetical protein